MFLSANMFMFVKLSILMLVFSYFDMICNVCKINSSWFVKVETKYCFNNLALYLFTTAPLK